MSTKPSKKAATPKAKPAVEEVKTETTKQETPIIDKEPITSDDPDFINIDELMDVMTVEKNPKPSDETTDETTDTDNDDDQAAPKPPPASTPKTELVVGKTIFTTTDYLLRQLAGKIAGETMPPLPEAQANELIEVWAEYAAQQQWGGIPTWVNLALMSSFTYGSLFKEALELRKAKAAAEEEISEAQLMRERFDAAANPNIQQAQEVPPMPHITKPRPDIKTDFEIPKKKGRGKRPASEQELVDTMKQMQAELAKLK